MGYIDQMHIYIHNTILGDYCDVIHCNSNRPPCSGPPDAIDCKTVHVRNGGWADITILHGEDPMCAIHV